MKEFLILLFYFSVLVFMRFPCLKCIKISYIICMKFKY